MHTYLYDADFYSTKPAQLSSKTPQEHDNNRTTCPKACNWYILQERWEFQLQTHLLYLLIGSGIKYGVCAYFQKNITRQSSSSHICCLCETEDCYWNKKNKTRFSCTSVIMPVQQHSPAAYYRRSAYLQIDRALQLDWTQKISLSAV